MFLLIGYKAIRLAKQSGPAIKWMTTIYLIGSCLEGSPQTAKSDLRSAKNCKNSRETRCQTTYPNFNSSRSMPNLIYLARVSPVCWLPSSHYHLIYQENKININIYIHKYRPNSIYTPIYTHILFIRRIKRLRPFFIHRILKELINIKDKKKA